MPNENNYRPNYYIYDVEIFPNFFGVTFIPEDTPQDLIDAYVKVDTLLLRNKYIKDESPDINYIKKLIEDKKKILFAMRIQQFIIWKDIKSNKFRNDLPLMMNFFESHKILTGYNSNNYDKTMIDLLIYNHRKISSDGWFAKENKHVTEFMFYHSYSCIDYGVGYYKLLGFGKYYKRPFRDFDIQKILYLDKSYTSLKQVAICLKWYRIQDLPLPYNKPILESDIVNINDYNVNDVLITLMLKREQKKEILLREDISKEFGIDVRNLSRSSIGKAITTELYSEFSGIPAKDFMDKKTDRWKIKVNSIVSNEISFKTPVLQNLLRIIKNQTIVVGSSDSKDKFKHVIRFADKLYTMALGGLHSQDNPIIYDYTDKYIYRDADVASYYPRGILHFGVAPQHLIKEAFHKVVEYTADTRVMAKHQAGDIKKITKKIMSKLHDLDPIKNSEDVSKLQEDFDKLQAVANKLTTKSEGLKIAINRMYGAFRDLNDYLYDPKCTYQTTINLQLALLMLIENLELKDIEVISANTDGIVCRFKPEQEEVYYEVCKWWQDYFKFELEFTDYEKYFRSDVNNYIAIKKGFKDELNKIEQDDEESLKELEDIYIKRKGLFIEEIEFNKGYNSPVVSKALNRFFIYGEDYNEYIKNYINTSKDAIYDYCISQKADNKFQMIFSSLHKGQIQEEVLQKSNRFYISKNGVGGVIFKRERDKTRETRIVAGYYSVVFNDFIEKEDYEINFGYYTRECNKVIYGKKKSKRGNNPKHAGILTNANTLFDGLFEKTDLMKEVENPVEEIIEVKREKSLSNIMPTEFKVNNTHWGMMGFSSKEEYDAVYSTTLNTDNESDIYGSDDVIDWADDFDSDESYLPF